MQSAHPAISMMLRPRRTKFDFYQVWEQAWGKRPEVLTCPEHVTLIPFRSALRCGRDLSSDCSSGCKWFGKQRAEACARSRRFRPHATPKVSLRGPPSIDRLTSTCCWDKRLPACAGVRLEGSETSGFSWHQGLVTDDRWLVSECFLNSGTWRCWCKASPS